MTGFLNSFTSLPNLHPALVHFPVALAVTALFLELVSLVLPRRTWWEHAAALLYALAAVGAVVTYLSGRQAADGVGAISARAEAVLATHADLALWTMLALAAAAVFRVTASLKDSSRPVARLGALRALALGTLLVALALVARTADLGGALVFRHGVAVKSAGVQTPRTAPSPTAPPVPEDPEVRLLRGEDGSLDWRPSARDSSALGKILTPLPGVDPTAVTSSATEGAGEGLELHVNGESFLMLPGKFGALAATAELDLTGFEGAVGLVHHAVSPDEAVLFIVATDGRARLVRRHGGKEKVFDTATIRIPGALVKLRTTAAGHHLKGFISGKLAVHGHGSSGSPGGVGLYLDGRGSIRVISIAVTPAAGH